MPLSFDTAACMGRFFCCTVLITLLLLISVALTITVVSALSVP